MADKEIIKYYSEFPSSICDLGRERRHQPCLISRTWQGQEYWKSQAWQRGSHAYGGGGNRGRERAKTCWVRLIFVLHFNLGFFSN